MGLITTLLFAAQLAGATGASPATPPPPSPPPAGSSIPAPGAMPPVPTPPDPTTVPGDPASTAIKLREVDTRMTVPVLINGVGPYRFIVDSGATRTVVSGRLAQELNLPSAGVVPLHSVGGEADVPAVTIASLYVGALPAKAITAPVLDQANLGGIGILGLDTLQGKQVVIDIAHGRMTVEPAGRGSHAPTSDEIVVTARSRFGQLVLADADVAGQHVYAIVDTGSMVTIGNMTLMRKLVRHRRAAPEQTIVTDVTGLRIPVLTAPTRDLRLGRVSLDNVALAFNDAHVFERFGLANKPAMLLGMDVLRSFARVSIDFAHRNVRLVRPQDDQGPVIRVGY